MRPLCATRRVPRLCSALLSFLSPAGGAANLLICRHCLKLQPVVSYSGYQGGHEEDGQGTEEPAGTPRSVRQRLLRRAWGRSLSPLDRVTRMIPPEFISEHVQELQSPEISGPRDEESMVQVTLSQTPSPSLGNTSHTATENYGAAPLLHSKESVEVVSSPQLRSTSLGIHFSHAYPQDNRVSEPLQHKEPAEISSFLSQTTFHDAVEVVSDPSVPQVTPFTIGDLVVAEHTRKDYSFLRRMFLLKQKGKFVTHGGAIKYEDILGSLPSQNFWSSTGYKFLLRRPSLEDYVCFMRKGPNIAFPKDITAMMTVMDVSPGDVVLEAGSGSGASSLFLSRAVGAEGCVYSFEMRSDHHAIAKSNYDIWRNAWQIRSGRPWPDNVRYIKKNILKALPDIKSIAFDGAVLDMLHPQIALPIITGNLKQGAVCAIYLANITQVIDLLEGLRVCKLPLLCETVMEVYLTKWLVTPSRQKDGTLSRKVSPRDLRQDDDKEEDVNEMNEGEKIPAGPEPFGQVPYLARPMPTQLGHTAFLVLLRKFKPAPPRSEDRM